MCFVVCVSTQRETSAEQKIGHDMNISERIALNSAYDFSSHTSLTQINHENRIVHPLCCVPAGLDACMHNKLLVICEHIATNWNRSQATPTSLILICKYRLIRTWVSDLAILHVVQFMCLTRYMDFQGHLVTRYNSAVDLIDMAPWPLGRYYVPVCIHRIQVKIT